MEGIEVAEKPVAVIFIAKDGKGVVDISKIHQWPLDAMEELLLVVTNKILARAGPSGEPMATPSICWYMTLLKLNSTEVVTVCRSSTNTSHGKGGGVRLLL